MIFESWVISEIYKARVHRGGEPDLYYWRDVKGLEIDLIALSGPHAAIVEIKSGQTFHPKFIGPLDRFAALVEKQDKLVTSTSAFLVYAGEETFRHGNVAVLPWKGVSAINHSP